MPKFEIGFTVRPGQDFDPELMARVTAPYMSKSDSVSTSFGVRSFLIFHHDGKLQYTNWDIDLGGEYADALELAGKLKVLFPEVQVNAPSEERPEDADWYGMFSSHGAEACARLLNETFERMGLKNGSTALRDALSWFVTERERLGREFGLTEINDTDVRERLWSQLEVGARERLYLDEDFQRAYDAVA